MSTDENESASIVEALRRLPDPIVFVHPKYAVAAVSSGASRCARSGTSKESRGAWTTRIEHTGDTDTTRTAVDGVGDETAMSELLFQQMLRHWKSELYRTTSSTTTIGGGGGGGGIKKQQNRVVQLLVTAAVPLPSTLPVVVEIVRCFMRYSGAAPRPEGTLSRCIHNALDLLLQWASPSMGFTLTVRSTGTALTAGVDVLYSTPTLLSPWMDNAVLVAMACAPEWSVRELCGSYRIAAWVHTHITASRLSNITPAQRLSRWNWLDKCLRALLSATDMAILARTLCALLIAAEVELIPQADTLFPRSASRDKEGLLLLLTVLAQRGGGGRGSVCIAADKDESDDNSESCDDFDSSLPEDGDSFIAAFLAEQTASVDFAPAPSHGVPMRRLRGVVDELYRFVAEWLRCAMSGALRGAAVPLREQSQRPDDLPGISLLVGQIDNRDDSPARGAAFPLSLLPVHLFSDVLQDRQLRCAVGRGFHRAAGLSAIDSSSARAVPSVAPLPLWPAAKKSPGAPVWLAELMVAGAVRSADMSPAQWRVRAGGLLPAALRPAAPRAPRGIRVEESPAGPVLRARHALREARYGLSAWEGFPALTGPAAPPQDAARSAWRALSMFVDPIVLQRSGAPARRPMSPEESAHAAQLRVCYAHLLRRAAAALDVGGRLALGLHLVPPLCARQALLRHAVGLSLVPKLLPGPPAVGSGATHSLADFCERYSALLKDSAVIRDMRRRYDAHGLTDAEFVERICVALHLPQNGFRVVGDVIHLTEETVACLAQQAAAAVEVEVEVEGDGLMDTTDYDEEDGINAVVSSATPRGAQRLHRANRKEPELTEQKEETTFHVFELQTARDAGPLDFEEWCSMIDMMLAPPTQTVNCSDTVLSF